MLRRVLAQMLLDVRHLLHFLHETHVASKVPHEELGGLATDPGCCLARQEEDKLDDGLNVGHWSVSLTVTLSPSLLVNSTSSPGTSKPT